MDFTTLEQVIGVTFENKKLLQTAFTHRSYLNENRRERLEHNERLEFLGDAVLEIIATEYLYHTYPHKTEGDMTAYRSALVNANTLSLVAERLKINRYVLLSRGEAKDTGRARQIILANAVEALIGAIYLDQGYATAQHFVKQHVVPLLGEIVASRGFIDAKSLFQEKAQELVDATPSYETLDEWGPDHDKHFRVGVFLKGEKIVEGEGKSKQEAEQQAAQAALRKKGWDDGVPQG